MFVDFFHDLKSNGVPVSLREYLSLHWLVLGAAVNVQIVLEELLAATSRRIVCLWPPDAPGRVHRPVLLIKELISLAIQADLRPGLQMRVRCPTAKACIILPTYDYSRLIH